MSTIIVKKSKALSGKISVSGSKNAALPILAATVMTKGKTVLHNIPSLSDVDNMLAILNYLGAKTEFADNTATVDFSVCKGFAPPYETVSRFRGSFLITAPLLNRMGRAKVAYPGGCPIGNRPIDLHLKGFGAMGAKIKNGHGYVDITAKTLRGNKIYLDFPSVGATENIIMAAVLAEGTTIIENAAAEPEIEDLINFLNKQGAKIRHSENTVTVEGVEELKPIEYTIISDRVEAGTFMGAFAITGGCGEVENINPSHLKPVTAKLCEMGAKISEKENSVMIDAGGGLVSKNIKTLPYPGFPTDMQAQFTALLCNCTGTGIIVETVFENRFLHVGELNRMGADIKIDGRSSVVEGRRHLSGAKVKAYDLRGGAALVLAGLAADGKTEIEGVEHINRGYEHLCEKLNSIGADITFSD